MHMDVRMPRAQDAQERPADLFADAVQVAAARTAHARFRLNALFDTRQFRRQWPTLGLGAFVLRWRLCLRRTQRLKLGLCCRKVRLQRRIEQRPLRRIEALRARRKLQTLEVLDYLRQVFDLRRLEVDLVVALGDDSIALKHHLTQNVQVSDVIEGFAIHAVILCITIKCATKKPQISAAF